jgi:hypothetical protein
VETAEAGGLPLGDSRRGGGCGGVATFGAVTAAAGVLLLLLPVEGGDGGHRLATLAALPVRRLCGCHCGDGRRHVVGVYGSR